MCVGVVIQVTAIKDYQAGLQFCIGRVITGVGNGEERRPSSSNANSSPFRNEHRHYPELGRRDFSLTQPWSPRLHRGVHDRHWNRHRLLVRSALLSSPVLLANVVLLRRVNFGLSFVKSSINWRLPITLQVIFAAGLLLGVHWLPECTSLPLLPLAMFLTPSPQLLAGSSPPVATLRPSVSSLLSRMTSTTAKRRS